jgi:hypothetical protein
MPQTNKAFALILGIFVFMGLSSLGYLLGDAVIEYKQYDRSVTVKGLSEREFEADIVIWPVQFSAAENDLDKLYDALEKSSLKAK